MHQIVLPEFRYPFPSVVNHHADLIHHETSSWAQRFLCGTDHVMYHRIATSNIGWLAARFHPSAPRDALQLVSDWYAWGFVHDDLCDETGLGKNPAQMMALHARCVEILHGGTPTRVDHRLTHGLWDLRKRLSTLASTIWMRRFTRSIKDYLDATVWEAINRVQGTIPDLETYLVMRRLTNALQTDTCLIELAEATHLPPVVFKHQHLQRLLQASENIVAWSNDIVSLAKEMQCGDVHNLVLVLQHADGCSLQAAVDRAAEMHNTELRVFLDLESRLPSFSVAVDRNVASYAAVLRARIRGSLDWASTSGRYRQHAPPSTSTSLAFDTTGNSKH
jgi:5-epi-alpha-selinene synthase